MNWEPSVKNLNALIVAQINIRSIGNNSEHLIWIQIQNKLKTKIHGYFASRTIQKISETFRWNSGLFWFFPSKYENSIITDEFNWGPHEVAMSDFGKIYNVKNLFSNIICHKNLEKENSIEEIITTSYNFRLRGQIFLKNKPRYKTCVRANQALSTNKSLCKEIIERSRLRTKCLRCKSYPIRKAYNR